jgi:hypothetical protein
MLPQTAPQVPGFTHVGMLSPLLSLFRQHSRSENPHTTAVGMAQPLAADQEANVLVPFTDVLQAAHLRPLVSHRA